MQITQLDVIVAQSHGTFELLSFPMKRVPPQSVTEMSVEKPLDCGGEARGVVCDARPEQLRWAGAAQLAEGWKEGARASGAWSDSEGLQGTRLFF